jgi:hypothetical protein
MTTLRAAAQQALEAYDAHEPLAVVMEALRTALAEPELKERVGGCTLCGYCAATGEPIHPPQRKPLTDEEILLDEVLRYHFGCNGGAGPVSQNGIKVIRAVERAHGIGGEA